MCDTTACAPTVAPATEREPPRQPLCSRTGTVPGGFGAFSAWTRHAGHRPGSSKQRQSRKSQGNGLAVLAAYPQCSACERLSLGERPSARESLPAPVPINAFSWQPDPVPWSGSSGRDDSPCSGRTDSIYDSEPDLWEPRLDVDGDQCNLCLECIPRKMSSEIDKMVQQISLTLSLVCALSHARTSPSSLVPNSCFPQSNKSLTFQDGPVV